MKCPFCGHTEDRVVDSRVGRDGEFIRRRRECLKCHRRYTTYEYIEDVLPHVVKRDNRREPFDRQKLRGSILKACEKRSVGVQAVDDVVAEIETKLHERAEKEITSKELGEVAVTKFSGGASWVFEDRKSPGAEVVEVEGPAFARYLFSNTRAGLLWLPIRFFLGFEWLTAGWTWLTRGRRDRGSLAVGAAGVAIVVAIALLVPSAQALGANRQAADRHLATDAAQWLDEALPQIAPHAVVVSWWSTSTPLWYAEFVQDRRTDIDVVDDRTILDRGYGSALGAITTFFGTRPVYIIRANGHDLGLILQEFVIRQVAGEGNEALYEVTGRSGAAE